MSIIHLEIVRLHILNLAEKGQKNQTWIFFRATISQKDFSEMLAKLLNAELKQYQWGH